MINVECPYCHREFDLVIERTDPDNRPQLPMTEQDVLDLKELKEAKDAT